jgi:hypothetical protein
MKTNWFVITLFFALILINAKAQDSGRRLSFELSGGAGFPVQKLGGTELETGLNLEGTLHYRLLEHTGIYAGWGWAHFAGNDQLDYEETGYVMGLTFEHPFPQSSINYYLRAGALYNHLEVEDDSGEIIDDTGHGWGIQAAAGVDIPIGSKWSLTPGVKFHALDRSLDNGGQINNLDLRYLSARVGLRKRF